MAISSDITKLEKRLAAATKTRNCPTCKARVESCETCGARIGLTPAEMQATDRKMTDLLNGIRERHGFDPFPHHGLTASTNATG